jgi:hypothetical protein
MAVEDVQRELDQQAATLSNNDVNVRVLVMNTSVR